MAGRIAARNVSRYVSRYVSRRFSSGGKVLGEEEKAAENVYIKKMEKEKLEKAARQGPTQAEGEAATSGAPAAEAVKPSGSETSAPKISTDKHRNYAVLAGVVTALGAAGWYYKSGSKKTEEVQE